MVVVCWCGGVVCVVSVCMRVRLRLRVRVQLIKDDRKIYKLLVRLIFTFRHLTPSISNFGFRFKIQCKILLFVILVW